MDISWKEKSLNSTARKLTKERNDRLLKNIILSKFYDRNIHIYKCLKNINLCLFINHLSESYSRKPLGDKDFHIDTANYVMKVKGLASKKKGMKKV